MKGLIPLIFSVLFLTCASSDIYINTSTLGTVRKIYIADFEKRSMKFDPYITANFRDALKFEFIKLGYKILPSDQTTQSNKSADNSAGSDSSNKLNSIYKTYKPDLIISGIVSEKDYGDALETNISTSIILYLYKRSTKIGEARYICDDTLENAKAIKKIAESLAKMINEQIE